MKEPEKKDYKSPDKFDRVMGSVAGAADVIKTKPSTVVCAIPVVGSTQTYIIQTMRQGEEGDTIFLQYMDSEGSVRIVLPPKVADAIARQRDALGTKNRRRAGKERAARDKAQGIEPGFKRKAAKDGV